MLMRIWDLFDPLSGIRDRKKLGSGIRIEKNRIWDPELSRIRNSVSKSHTHLSGHEVGELLYGRGQVEPGEARHQPAHPPGQATQHHQVLIFF
jgi:hypothetical protein